jgi:DUF971 family protein
MMIRPLRLKIVSESKLEIDWSDSVISSISIQRLRNSCPCASCREKSIETPNPLRVLTPSEILPLRLIKMEPVGHYAYKITWSDGHDSGIYSVDYLRSL